MPPVAPCGWAVHRRRRRSRAGLKFRGKIGLIGGCGLSMALRMQAVERGPDLAPAIQLRAAGLHAAVAPRVGASAGTYPR